MQLHQMTIRQAHQALADKKCSALDLTNACLEQIEKLDGAGTSAHLNAFITVTAESARAQATAIDARGVFDNPLCGIPVAIKDLLCTKDIRTTAASNILSSYVPPYTCTAVQKLFDAGAIMVGKTNLDEFACGASNETSYFGPVRNPWDTTRVPGGSSGGSAVAVAADECMYALGTDTGGSIRQPASLTNTVGIKPTYGRVSRFGALAMASSLDQIGPIGKTVEDAALVLQAIAGKDKHDSTTSSVPVPDYTVSMHQSIKGMTIGVPKECFVEGMQPAVTDVIKTAISKLQELGANVVEVSLPFSAYGLAVYYILMPSELSSNLARYDGVRFGLSANADGLLENYKQTRGSGFGAEIRRRIMLGTYALSSGYYDAYYKQAQKVRTLVVNDFKRVYEQVDCIMMPTSPTIAFKLGEKTADPLSMYLADIFTVTANIAGVPGISVPCGFAQAPGGSADLPVGMQLLGKHFDEASIIRAAYQYEQATDWHTHKPTL